MDQRIKELIEKNKTDFFADLNKVISVASVKGEPAEKAPFGKEPKAALELVMQLAESYGFQTKIVNDAVGYAQLGTGPDYIGIIGHLDVVPAGNGWDYPPFQLTEDQDRLYGRGILDNKGPIISCLYGLKLLKELEIPLSKTIRIIFGTDEESGSADIPLYLAKEKPPVFGFTPDCKYPVVYGERGIVNYEIITPFPKNELEQISQISGDQAKDHVPDELTVAIKEKEIEIRGVRAPSNAPELGKNAITLLAEKINEENLVQGRLADYFSWLENSLAEKHYGEGLHLDFEDQDSGKLIITPYQLEKRGDNLVLAVAIRYPVSFSETDVTEKLKENIPGNGTLNIVRSIKGNNFPKDNENIKKLSEVYEKVTGLDGTPVTTTGATYARSMPNTVAFGPSFPGQKGIAHNKNEYMNTDDLLKNMEIYMNAIVALTE